MAVKGEALPAGLGFPNLAAGWMPHLFFVQILPPEASDIYSWNRCWLDHSDLEISSFMISLVPP